MSGPFKDHFSGNSAGYAAYRPRYPAALAHHLAALAPGRSLAYDAGCGSGQLSVLLAAEFDRVVASDASAQQIAKAEPAPRVEYRVAPAQDSGLPAASTDLVTAAQAAHWFDLPAFYAEARRIGRPGAALALVTYGILTFDDPAFDTAFTHFYGEVVGPYWPFERRHVESGYRTLDFPFPELDVPALSIEVAWDLAAFLGYVGTWSAVKEARAAIGEAPLADFASRMADLWGDGAAVRPIRFPLSVRAGRIHPPAV